MQIAIASGKGGTGKTLVATSLAVSLQGTQGVTLIDCDVEEPDDAIFIDAEPVREMPVHVRYPEVDESLCTYCAACADVCAFHAIIVIRNHVLTFPGLCHGCGACMYCCPEGAIKEKQRESGNIEEGTSGDLTLLKGTLSVGETMATPVINAVKTYANNDGPVLVDSPPGTSCPVIHAVRGSDFCILVTEPTPFGLHDLKLACEAVTTMGIPCGVIINRSGEGDSPTEEFCREKELPVLLKIPLDIEIARLYSKGITLAEGKPEWKKAFLSMFGKIQELAGE